MTRNASLKHAVRARMAETGEKYTVALRAILLERAKRDAERAATERADAERDGRAS